jgi:hypothetical protein
MSIIAIFEAILIGRFYIGVDIFTMKILPVCHPLEMLFDTIPTLVNIANSNFIRLRRLLNLTDWRENLNKILHLLPKGDISELREISFHLSIRVYRIVS